MKTDFDEIKRNIELLQKTMKHVVDEHTRKQTQIDVSNLIIVCR